jgi:hypothetical protein
MQHNNKHTDEKLQELENQSLPDLSAMDEHWQQMKTLLQPGVVPAQPKNVAIKKYFRWMIAAVFIGGLFFLTYTLVNNTRQKKTTAGNEKLKQPFAKQPTDSIPAYNILIQKKDSVTIRSSDILIQKDPVTIKKFASLQFKTKIITPKDTVIQPTPLNVKMDPPVVDAKVTLANFFKQLEKQSQQFVINNKKDTVINGEDGTALLIPANTFDSKDEVVITMKEFYSYEDIITNKLSTCSNGQQLITGGMIHIMATINGKEVNIQPGKSIRWFVPDTTTAINQMQLFTGSTAQTSWRSDGEDGEKLRDFFKRTGTDTVGRSGTLETVNWIPQYQFFSTDYLVTTVKVLYLPNDPFRTRQTRKGDIGFFHIADKPKISREEVKEELKEKYGYYKVKIRKPKRDNFFTRTLFGYRRRLELLGSSAAVGDSAWIKDDVAKMYRLQATDTNTAIRRNTGFADNGYYIKRSFANINLNDLAKRFSVDIRTLGWINCDRFINNGQPKIDYYVDLKDTAANYYTLLVFDKMRSMMAGYANGNRIVFNNIPEGESAKVISVGIQNGKTVAAMESVQLSKTPLTNLKFEETSPAAFKEEMKGFDK